MTLLPMLSPGLRAVASTQRGAFTAAQAYALGHTQKELQRLRQARLIMSLRRGVYVDMVAWADADPVERLRLRTAGLALALTAPAVLSHQSAAAELGLPLLAPDHTLLHVTRENRAGTRLEAGVDHHVAELHDHEVVDLRVGSCGSRLQRGPPSTSRARPIASSAPWRLSTPRFATVRPGASSPQRWIEPAAGRERDWPAAHSRWPTVGLTTLASHGPGWC